MRQNKKGAVGVTEVLGILMLVYLIFVTVSAVSQINNNTPWGEAVSDSFVSVGENFSKVFGPLFAALLGFDQTTGGNINFLKLITFILIAVIIVSILDTANMFGEGRKGNITNLVVGIIVSIIGVRFMPNNVWTSLTAPASAFVATMLVAIPFAALFFVTMKLKSGLGRKLMWIFYMVFLTYLILTTTTEGIIAVYWVFIGLSVVMMFFDSSVRGFMRKEKEGRELNTMLAGMTLLDKQKIREDIRKYSEIVGDSDSPPADVTAAKKKLATLRKKYGQNLEDI